MVRLRLTGTAMERIKRFAIGMAFVVLGTIILVQMYRNIDGYFVKSGLIYERGRSPYNDRQ